jgi:hypothetical protein
MAEHSLMYRPLLAKHILDKAFLVDCKGRQLARPPSVESQYSLFPIAFLGML